MPKRHLHHSKYLHLVYVATDFILIFLISLFAFLTYYRPSGMTGDALTSSLLYCTGISALSVLVLFLTRIYKMLTTNVGLLEALEMIIVTAAVQIVGIFVIALVPQLPNFKDFVFVWVLAAGLTSVTLPGTRFLWRLINLAANLHAKRKEGVRTLVIGAGSAAKIVVDESRKNKDNHNNIVVFVDDDINKIGGMFASLPIKGPISKVGEVIDYFEIEEVIIAIANLSQERLQEILGYLDACDVRVRRLPLISEMEGPNDTRIVDVNLDELLCREPVKLDNTKVIDMLHGKTVMVTGAGGSIGSELTRQIFHTHPSTLVLFDIYENSTYDIQQELRRYMRDEGIKDVNLVTLIGSTYNAERVEQVMKRYRPDYIYHAAAYKHVPLMEDSPAEAIRTNVIGTYNVARLADKYGVKKMVLVSTDKAVRPTNVMGATKRFAETIIQYFSDHSKNTAYAAVRFGNVLGSNGSVVPLFKKQIEAGGPITLTHKDIIRYFMTIPEAVSLILQCGLFANGGEIFILDMGKPVKIVNLAEKLIRQAGLVPYKDIDIVEVGLRPGEKLFEELLLDREHQQKTENDKIYVEEKEAIYPIEDEIVEISKAFHMDEVDDIRNLLASIIKTYTPTPNN